MAIMLCYWFYSLRLALFGYSCLLLSTRSLCTSPAILCAYLNYNSTLQSFDSIDPNTL